MSHRLSSLICIVSMAFLAGCVQIVPATSTSTVTPQSAEKAVETTADTQTQTVLYVTATPVPVQYIVVTATPAPVTDTPTATVTPTITPTKTSTIEMAQVLDQGNGTIYVSWNADGDFPNGFQVVWSTTNTMPVYPTDSSSYFNDPGTRTMTFQGEYGRTYYIRVCRYENNTCDLYSNVATVTVTSGANNSVYPYNYDDNYNYNYNYDNSNDYYRHNQTFFDYRRAPYYFAPTVTPVTDSITITGIRGTGYGAAIISWQAVGDFPNGFLILYSSAPSQPVYGDYSAVTISNGGARSAAISGTHGMTYYYRMCRFTGSSCNTYSNVYTFTY